MGDIPIPDDWDGETYCCYSVMWPNSFLWRAILNGLIDLGGTGFYYNEQTGSVIAARDAIQATWEYNFQNEVVFMTCTTETNEIFERIAVALEAIQARECCPTGSPGSGVFNSGSRGAGISVEPPNSYEETPEETPPPGFDNWAEYRTHKCNASADLVLAFKTDLLNISNLTELEDSTFTALIGLLVTVLLTPVPYDDLAYLIGLLTVAAIEYSFLAELSAEVQDNAESLVCTLYNSADATDAQSSFRAEVSDIIDGMSISELGKDWLKNVTEGLTPMDAFNNLFTNVSTTTQDWDCSGCGPEPLWQIENNPGGGGGATIVTGNLATGCILQSVYVDLFGGFREYMQISTTTHPENRYLEIVSIPQAGSGPYTVHVYVSDVDTIAFASEDWNDLLTEIPAGMYSGIQITTNDAGIEDEFRIQFNFTEP